MEYYSAIIEKEILPFMTIEMDLKGIMQSEVSKTEKDKYCTDLTYVCDLKTHNSETE